MSPHDVFTLCLLVTATALVVDEILIGISLRKLERREKPHLPKMKVMKDRR